MHHCLRFFYLIGLNRAQNYYIYLYLQRKIIFLFLVLQLFLFILSFCGLCDCINKVCVIVLLFTPLYNIGYQYDDAIMIEQTSNSPKKQYQNMIIVRQKLFHQESPNSWR